MIFFKQKLKVWRGFNGNIYFEPIQFHHFHNPDQTHLSTAQQTLRKALPLSPDKRARTDGEIILNKSKISNRFNNVQSNQSNLPNINTSTLDNHDDNASNDGEFIFITQQNQQETIEYPRNFTSISSFIQQNQLHTNQKIHQMATPLGNHNFPMTNISEHQFQQQQLVQLLEPTTPKYTSNPLVKSRSNFKKKETIQPNPNASKHKGPSKGLAYKEVREKIIDKLVTTNPLAYYTSNLDETYLEQLSKEEPAHQDVSQAVTPKNDKKRLDYKNMMKKIRKGISKIGSSVNNQQSYENQQQQHQQNKLAKLARSDRTTSAYLAYNNRNRLQTSNNELMLNAIQSTSDFNTVSSNKNKILEVKGDRISIDIILNAQAPFTAMSRHKSNFIIRNKTFSGFDDAQSHNTGSVATTLETYNTHKYNLDKNYLYQNVVKSPENINRASSLVVKSSFSSYSLIGLTGKRINPTPDFDHSNNNSSAFGTINSKIY